MQQPICSDAWRPDFEFSLGRASGNMVESRIHVWRFTSLLLLFKLYYCCELKLGTQCSFRPKRRLLHFFHLFEKQWYNSHPLSIVFFLWSSPCDLLLSEFYSPVRCRDIHFNQSMWTLQSKILTASTVSITDSLFSLSVKLWLKLRYPRNLGCFSIFQICYLNHFALYSILFGLHYCVPHLTTLDYQGKLHSRNPSTIINSFYCPLKIKTKE